MDSGKIQTRGTLDKYEHYTYEVINGTEACRQWLMLKKEIITFLERKNVAVLIPLQRN